MQSIDLGDTARDAVQQGIPFLDRARKGGIELEGKTLIVIGGGNVAIDVARTARRLSAAAVRVCCLETRDDMPALAEEVEEALAEGIEIHAGWGPAAGLSNQGKLEGVEFRRCLSVFDERGRFAPSFDENDRMRLDADTVILALGCLADLSILPDGVEPQEDKPLHLGPTGATVFVVGDFATGDGTVTGAVASGRRAAWHIHRVLTGENLFPPARERVAVPEDILTHLFTHAPRERGTMLPPDVRRTGFAEVHGGLLDESGRCPALAEAGRCFSCGVCNQCDRCVAHCPEGVVRRDGEEYCVEDLYCQGCGTCAAECPRGVILMTESHTESAEAQ